MEIDSDNEGANHAVSTVPPNRVNQKPKPKSTKPYNEWKSKEFSDAIEKGTLKVAKNKGGRAKCWSQFHVKCKQNVNNVNLLNDFSLNFYEL